MMTPLTFKNINDHPILLIPHALSETFPSRGMVMGDLTLDSKTFKVPIEPDGDGHHLVDLDTAYDLQINAGLEDLIPLKSIDGTTFEGVLKITKDWVEPLIPDDIYKGLETYAHIDNWDTFTTKAKWEWIRWVRSTENPQTRQKRIDVMNSKIDNGKKRPCCFNAGMCTITDISKSGVVVNETL